MSDIKYRLSLLINDAKGLKKRLDELLAMIETSHRLYEKYKTYDNRAGHLARAMHEVLYNSYVQDNVPYDGVPTCPPRKAFVVSENLSAYGMDGLKDMDWLFSREPGDIERFKVSKLLHEVRDYLQFESYRWDARKEAS